jgi:hypothetical protein
VFRFRFICMNRKPGFNLIYFTFKRILGLWFIEASRLILLEEGGGGGGGEEEVIARFIF